MNIEKETISKKPRQLVGKWSIERELRIHRKGIIHWYRNKFYKIRKYFGMLTEVEEDFERLADDIAKEIDKDILKELYK